MRYKTESEIEKIVESFKNKTLPQEIWRHAEHLTIAIYYALNNNSAEALEKMRRGILDLNEVHGVITTNERGYHETLTVFWIHTVSDYIKLNPHKSLLDLTNEIIEKFDKNYPLNFYTRERLFSVEARYGFVEADLR